VHAKQGPRRRQSDAAVTNRQAWAVFLLRRRAMHAILVPGGTSCERRGTSASGGEAVLATSVLWRHCFGLWFCQAAAAGQRSMELEAAVAGLAVARQALVREEDRSRALEAELVAANERCAALEAQLRFGKLDRCGHSWAERT
jgi:hypothetical protein